jgi:hypothetical protein
VKENRRSNQESPENPEKKHWAQDTEHRQTKNNTNKKPTNKTTHNIKK